MDRRRYPGAGGRWLFCGREGAARWDAKTTLRRARHHLQACLRHSLGHRRRISFPRRGSVGTHDCGRRGGGGGGWCGSGAGGRRRGGGHARIAGGGRRLRWWDGRVGCSWRRSGVSGRCSCVSARVVTRKTYALRRTSPQRRMTAPCQRAPSRSRAGRAWSPQRETTSPQVLSRTFQFKGATSIFVYILGLNSVDPGHDLLMYLSMLIKRIKTKNRKNV